ncbi:Golgi transport complex subunit 4 [Vermiconidia calcicola]|uniref:Golgi transport complex subunit 4 n=1 Tax=Vermiconidia calcicola TaxID=1690605 RepID=A0ACC3N7Y3_9PEZI|nr:Golgi transport complex subunit 4 [Vermiconidia calcicola]
MSRIAPNGTHTHSKGGEASSVYTATSVAEIRASLTELSHRESSITTRLHTLLTTQKDLARSLSRLDLARAHLGSQALATRSISNGMLGTASRTASRISSAVRTLDREQAAVKSTLDVVEQVAELKACVLGVNGSMGAPQDWETAASYLQRAREIPESVIEGAFAEEVVPTAEVPDSPRVTLEVASEGLCGLFLREFEKAAREGDGGRVTRFFKLFPLIGRKEVGLDAYGRGQQQQGVGMFYAGALTKLFEHIAQIVDGHEPLVERHYGVGSMTKVVERIQMEADVQGGIILDTWAEERRVGRKLTDVKSYPFNFLVQSFLPSSKPSNTTPRSGSPAPARRSEAEDETVDMKEIDALLNESALMLGRWTLYTRFLASKTTTQQDPHLLHIPGFITDSTLHSKISTHLTDPFNTMSTFFFRRSVEKAFQLDESPAPSLSLSPSKPIPANVQPPFITSAVDDVMYIVNQVLQRVLSTGQKNVVASVVPSIGRVLGSDFFGMVQRRMRDESYPKAAIQGALPPEGVIVQFLVLMNNLDVATEYIGRIVGSTLGGGVSLADRFPFGNEAVAVEKALRNLEGGFKGKTDELLVEATEVMLKQVLRPRLRPVMVETFRDADYLIPSSDSELHGETEEEEEDDAVPKRFERGWQSFTLPIKRILTATNYTRLLTSLVSHLARTLEKRLWACRISPLGAVKLERDVSGIVNVACRGGNGYELRDSFARCVQLVLVVGMEEDEWEEVCRLEGGELERVSGVRWRLDAGERRRARGLLVGR